ncbi:MAG: hypothetical protein Q8L13_03555 [Bradyrhizobium sp.]|uniref:nSTAND1 domain-containing NTPase n=1 Tax=Bradyrhizobium sp. TaxID=376 RepID=UPI00272EEB3E|nr:hypothetical protein [Bradyrhizobium sp.]MDP1865409.1 hypothetical protein [Bradyrhizobium sp.]
MYISAAAAPRPNRSTISWPSNPYKGLSYYTPVDAGLFGGREKEVQTCAQILSEEDLKVLLLHGTTGCGKSSFLRAGLIPYLESTVGGFQFLRTFDAMDVKTLFIRCTDAPLHRLCEILYDWGETPFRIDLPELGMQEILLLPIRAEASSREEFVNDNATSVDNLLEVLRRLGRLLPRTVVLVIDQGEEILTLDQQDSKGNRRIFFDFLIAFGKATIDVKIIVALRKEYFGDFFPELDSRRYNRDKLRAFQLRELSKEQLVEAIRIPTSRNVRPKYLQGRKQPGEHYNFEFEFGLPERIVADLQKTKTSGGVLPVLQITCERLYRTARKRDDNSLLTFGSKPLLIASSDYAKLGAPDTQVRQYIDEAIEAGIAEHLPAMKGFELEDERDRWKDVLHSMVYKQSDNTALTRICSEQQLLAAAQKMECLADVGRMAKFLSNDDRRILRNDSRGQKTNAGPVSVFAGPLHKNENEDPNELTGADPQYYSLGHDAIAVELDYWGSARNVIKTRRGFLRRIIEVSAKTAAAYLILFSLFFTFATVESWNVKSIQQSLSDPPAILSLLVSAIFFFIGINLAIFSKQIAQHMDGVLIRSQVFRTFLTSRPAE